MGKTTRREKASQCRHAQGDKILNSVCDADLFTASGCLAHSHSNNRKIILLPQERKVGAKRHKREPILGRRYKCLVPGQLPKAANNLQTTFP
jgi:hypothetical protein